MFWKYNTNLNSPQIEAALYKEDVTLQELMDEEEIINECKLQNKKLIDFLVRPEVMEELVTLTTAEPSSDIDEEFRFKYPNIACELLTCDVPTLNERLAGDEALLSKLYTFIDNEPPLNPLLSSFFSKIMGVLIAKRSEQNWLSYQFTCLQVLEFLKAKDNFISLLLKHIGTSAIMDLTLKLMTQVEGVEMRQNILNWLDSQRIIQNLIGLLDVKVDSERHFNVAQLLCDFIKTARDTLRNVNITERSDPLLNTLESPETITLLMGHMFDEEKCESSIVGGIQVILALLDVNKSSIPNYDSVNQYSNSNSYDEISDQEQKQAVVQTMTSVILTRLKDFHNILLDPPKKSEVRTSVGVLDPPLGNTRLQVCKLLASLFASGNPDFMNEIMSLGTINVLLDLFFKYNWNNFLHFQVEQCIASAFVAHVPSEREGENALYIHLIVNCRLIDRVLEAWDANEQQQAESKGLRQGYMGSLINIANNIVKLYTSSALGEFIKENVSEETYEKWITFKDGALEETNKTQQILLGGVHPTNINEDSDEFREMPYAISQQGVYTEFQIQQMSPAVIEGYGYNDDFGDSDDPLQALGRRPQMNFDLNEGDLCQQQEIFKQICEQNINTLDADDQIFEDRSFPFQSSGTGSKSNRDNHSSDSDEEGEDNSPADDPLMGVDPWSSSPVLSSNTMNNENFFASLNSGDPWALTDHLEASAGMGGNGSWADFSQANFDDFDAQFAQMDTSKSDDVFPQEDVKDVKKEKPPSADVSVAGAEAATAAVGNVQKKNEQGNEAEGKSKKDDDKMKEEAIATEVSSIAATGDVAEILAQNVDTLNKDVEALKVDAKVAEDDSCTTSPQQSEDSAAESAPGGDSTAQPSITSSPPASEDENVSQASV